MQPMTSDRRDASGLFIRILLAAIAAVGVIGILLVAPAEAATVIR